MICKQEKPQPMVEIMIAGKAANKNKGLLKFVQVFNSMSATLRKDLFCRQLIKVLGEISGGTDVNTAVPAESGLVRLNPRIILLASHVCKRLLQKHGTKRISKLISGEN